MTLSRRILLVSFHFGPAAATGGFRWGRLVPLLAERGWRFDVLTRDVVPAGHFPDSVTVHSIAVPRWADVAGWLLDGLPGDAKAMLRRMTQRRPAARPPEHASLASTRTSSIDKAPRSRRLARTLEDAAEEVRMLGWAVAAASVGTRLGGRDRFKAVVVSTPPHSTHLAGLELSRSLGIPYIPDFRDPWVFGIGDSIRNATPAYRWLGRFFEPRIHEEATAVVRNAELESRVIGRLFPRYRAKQRTILNGHDLSAPPAVPDRERFRLVYTGHLHSWMDPRPFFEACRDVFASRPDIAERAEIHFMGVPERFGDADIREIAAESGLSAHFHYRPRGPRAEANALQESAAVLLAYDCTHPLGIPAKFFDYAYMRGEMLLVGHPDGAMAEVAAPLGVRVHDPADGAGLRAAIEQAFGRWRDGLLTFQNDRDGMYARPVQAAQWDALLQEIVERRGR